MLQFLAGLRIGFGVLCMPVVCHLAAAAGVHLFARPPALGPGGCSCAELSGRVTVEVGPDRVRFPVRHLTLYAIDVRTATPVLELQRQSRELCGAGLNTHDRARLQTCADLLWQLYKTIPSLKRASMTETDQEDRYRFGNLRLGLQYLVIGIEPEEVDFVVVGLSPPLDKVGPVRLNLSENDRWDRELKPAAADP